jgi:NDP-hexose 3,5-(Or5-) epimerase
MAISGAYRIVPTRLSDVRGEFFEGLRVDTLRARSGQRFALAQVNYSVSCRNTIRGIHATRLPPGQVKIVTCVHGAAFDVVVDLRVGSPTFGHHEITRQDAAAGVSVYLADGLGHAFLALTDEVRMSYLCSEAYVPGTMIEVDALDPAIGIPWPLTGPAIRSAKDTAAPTLAGAVRGGGLPTYDQWRALDAELGARP